MTQTKTIHQSPSSPVFEKTVQIAAPVSIVWAALTDPVRMNRWMAEDELEILTDWQVGSPLIIRGHLHGIQFENKGQVLKYEDGRALSYSHLSSLSRLPDVPDSYSVAVFRLTPVDGQTRLALTLRNFPTESIHKHLAFYWNVTLEVLKRTIEAQE